MRRRLWTFALAVVVAGAPAVATICQVACNSHEMDARSHSSHQHTHRASTPLVGATMGPAAHTCDDLVDDTLAIQQALQSLIAPAIGSVQAFAFQPPPGHTLARHAGVLEQSPPGILALTIQLRV